MNTGGGRTITRQFVAVTSLLLLLSINHSAVLGLNDLSSAAEYNKRPVAKKHVEASPLAKRVADLVKGLVDYHKSAVPSPHYNAKKVMLETSRFYRVFAQQLRDFDHLVRNPSYKPLLNPDRGPEPINPSTLLEFEKALKEQILATRRAIDDHRDSLYTSQIRIQMIKDEIFAMNDKLNRMKKEQSYVDHVTAPKLMPKSIHCFLLKLMQERMDNPDKYKYVVCSTLKAVFEDPKLYHYAIFSDNSLAASVVVNSLVTNANEPHKHVIHIVTDKANLMVMQVMIQSIDDRGAHIEIKAVEDFKFLKASYVPVLRQQESEHMQKFYYANSRRGDEEDDQSNFNQMKFRNPKYLAILNHLRFYLPEMYPRLTKILFLDDDVVVQKDLTGLWEVDMDGKVNGAVQTCRGTFHRYSQYFNFSNPLIRARLDPKACAWAYGMNMFDLDAWRRENSTEEYHYWQNLNENRLLWSLGSLPPGLITFYSTTKPMNKTWHVLGLGFNPSISMEEIQNAAVVHFNGDRKPWLDTAIPKFKPLWAKYVDADSEFVRGCNFDFHGYGQTSA